MARTFSLVLFFGVFSSLMFVATLVVFETLQVAFSLFGAQSAWIEVGLMALTISFVVATIIGSHAYNWFTRAYYMIAAVWVGYFTYLFFAAVVYGVLVGVFGDLPHVFSIIFLAIPLAVGTYGLWHARRIRITYVPLTLPNLPPAWYGRRAVWISDVHLGQLHGPNYAKKVVATINALPHDLVFIGGDLYDGTGAPDIEELAVPFGTCKAPLGKFFISGNHEEYGDSSRFFRALQAVGIRTLIDEMVEIDGVQIVGVDYRHATNPEGFKDVLNGMSLNSERPIILLKHGPVNLDIGADAGVSFQISGHTHNGQMWPFGYLASLVHKGYGYGLKRFRDMQVYVSSGAGTWGPPMRVGTDSEIVVFIFG